MTELVLVWTVFEKCIRKPSKKAKTELPAHSARNPDIQGVILVPEPHSELNASFVVLYASSHEHIVDLSELAALLHGKDGQERDQYIQSLAGQAVEGFSMLTQRYLGTI